MGHLAPLDTCIIRRLVIVFLTRYCGRETQLTAIASLCLLCHFHLIILLRELSKVHAQVDRLRSNNCLITAGEELEYLESAGFHVRGPILDEEGARELERIIHLDGLNVCLADGSFHLELLGL